MHQAPLAQRRRERLLDRGQQPGAAVGDHQHRRAQAAAGQVLKEVDPGVVALAGGRGQADQHRAAGGGGAVGDQHRLGPGAGVVAKAGAVQVQVVQLDLGQAAGRPGGELLGKLGADPTHRRARQCGLGAERLGQGGLHIPGGQATDEPGDDQRLQRVGPRDLGAQQRRGEPLVGAAEHGTLQGEGAAGGLDGHRLVAVAMAWAGIRVALVALPAQERGHFGLQRGLEQQPSPEPSDVLQDVGQLAGRVGEQLIDLGADALDRRYSCRHGRGSPF
jgi:hypothetical protein